MLSIINIVAIEEIHYFGDGQTDFNPSPAGHDFCHLLTHQLMLLGSP